MDLQDTPSDSSSPTFRVCWQQIGAAGGPAARIWRLDCVVSQGHKTYDSYDDVTTFLGGLGSSYPSKSKGRVKLVR